MRREPAEHDAPFTVAGTLLWAKHARTNARRTTQCSHWNVREKASLSHHWILGPAVRALGVRARAATRGLPAGLGERMCPKCQSEGSDRKCKDCKVPTRHSRKLFLEDHWPQDGFHVPALCHCEPGTETRRTGKNAAIPGWDQGDENTDNGPEGFKPPTLSPQGQSPAYP